MLRDNALITVEEYITFLGKDPVNVTYQDFEVSQIEMFIGLVSEHIERTCGRKFITPAAAVAEIFSGNDRGDYYTDNGRVNAAPTLAYWDGDSWVALDSNYTWAYDQDSGRVYFTDGSLFWKGSDNWKITYSYGWALADVPPDLKYLCQSEVRRRLLLMEKEGLKTEAVGEASTSYNLTETPQHLKDIYDRYRRVML